MISIAIRETEDGQKAFVYVSNAEGTELLDVTEHYSVAEMLIEDNEGETRAGWFVSKTCEALETFDGE